MGGDGVSIGITRDSNRPDRVGFISNSGCNPSFKILDSAYLALTSSPKINELAHP
jgi:hypothetical protein